ncbi:MAG: serine--tRNA ligase, partial [Gammaproteobacteria bacterium]|nr:serine--tRNA ligase [Gammaproteobacteria bacterium]
MLDVKTLKKEPKKVAENLLKRGFKLDINAWSKLEESRKLLQSDTEKMQAELNQVSKQIGTIKNEGKDSSDLQKQATKLTSDIKEKSKELDTLLNKINQFIISLPNLVDDDIPEGNCEEDNLEIRKWGEVKNFNFIPKDHLELGKELNGIDMELGVKITGSRYSVLKTQIAKLQRSLINFMLDVHIEEHGYEEVYVPYVVNSESLLGTGQLPKFEEDLFKLEGKGDFYLTSTAEVPVTNIFRNEILESSSL